MRKRTFGALNAITDERASVAWAVAAGWAQQTGAVRCASVAWVVAAGWAQQAGAVRRASVAWVVAAGWTQDTRSASTGGVIRSWRTDRTYSGAIE